MQKYYNLWRKMATATSVRTITLAIPSKEVIMETSFITTKVSNEHVKLELLKNEAIDRLDSIVDDLPKYKEKLNALILNFTVDEMLQLMNHIYRDRDFKASQYFSLYNRYFDEIEDLIYKYK
jgi:hypothetical protein